jgi:hypothetical protein
MEDFMQQKPNLKIIANAANFVSEVSEKFRVVNAKPNSPLDRGLTTVVLVTRGLGAALQFVK